MDYGQISASESNVPLLLRPSGIYNAAPLSEAVLKRLAALRKRGVSGSLVDVHVLEVTSAIQHGTTARASLLLEHDQPSVMAAVESEMTLAGLVQAIQLPAYHA